MPPAFDSRAFLPGTTQIQVKQICKENTVLKVDFTTISGFESGFGENFRKTFDKQYWEQLEEVVFRFKRRHPQEYIWELVRQITLNDTQLVALKKKFYQDWAGNEHVKMFGARLKREQNRYRGFVPPINISNEDIKHHYLKHMLKRPEVYNKECMKE